MQYYVESVGIANVRVGAARAEGFRVTLTLRRRVIRILMTTYLPTVLIAIVAFSTNYYQPSWDGCALEFLGNRM